MWNGSTGQLPQTRHPVTAEEYDAIRGIAYHS